MARKKRPAGLTTAELQAQQEQVTTQLAGVQGGLLNMEDIGQESYFAQTNEEALTKKELPKFSDIYNPLYEKTKNIRFSLGEDISTANADAAFYVFNPETEAKKQADLRIAEVEGENIKYEEQQKRIEEFLKQEGEAQKLGIENKYIESVLAKSPQLQAGYSSSLESGFDMNAYRQARNKDRRVSYAADRTKIYSYKLPEEIAASKLQTLREVETLRFRSDPTLQTSEIIKYQETLEKQLKDLNKTIAKKLKQEAKATAKAEKKANKKKKRA
jgi:hypothetical protein